MVKARTVLARATAFGSGIALTTAGSQDLAGIFKALSDPQRVQIINMLVTSDEAQCVSDIAGFLGLEDSQSRVSYHIKQLVNAGLIEGERDGNLIFYSLVDDALDKLAALFDAPLAGY